MKKVIICILVNLIAVFLYGQQCPESFLGSKTLYQKQQTKYTTLPKGYLPVFINYVGRHGARHLTKDVNTSYLYQLLLKADSVNGLTADGRLLKEKILKLEKVEKKNVKSISYEGKIEQQGIADRMYENNTAVFNTTRPVLNVTYTKEIRTLQTSDAFLNELKTKITEPSIARKINDTTLRFYDLSPAYDAYKERGKWQQNILQLRIDLNYKEVARQISQRFFAGLFYKSIDEKDQSNFSSELYGFITIFFSIKQEIKDAGYKSADVDMQSFLTCRQLSVLDKIDNAEDFFAKGPGSNVNGTQVKIALPLLADFINTTDEYINTKKVNAQLRFSHAETISPFATLLNITCAAETTKKIADINKVWRADKIIPLSSNIQWVLYQKKGSENYLIKFLLNEKEVAIKGVSTKTFPYYKWDDVRTFYIKKIVSFDTNLDTDFLKYLKEVK